MCKDVGIEVAYRMKQPCENYKKIGKTKNLEFRKVLNILKKLYYGQLRRPIITHYGEHLSLIKYSLNEK